MKLIWKGCGKRCTVSGHVLIIHPLNYSCTTHGSSNARRVWFTDICGILDYMANDNSRNVIRRVLLRPMTTNSSLNSESPGLLLTIRLSVALKVRRPQAFHSTQAVDILINSGHCPFPTHPVARTPTVHTRTHHQSRKNPPVLMTVRNCGQYLRVSCILLGTQTALRVGGAPPMSAANRHLWQILTSTHGTLSVSHHQRLCCDNKNHADLQAAPCSQAMMSQPEGKVPLVLLVNILVPSSGKVTSQVCFQKQTRLIPPSPWKILFDNFNLRIVRRSINIPNTPITIILLHAHLFIHHGLGQA